MEIVYLGLGSNLGDREKYLEDALFELEQNGLFLQKKSSILATKPLGGLDQPQYLNMVARFQTSLKPLELLRLCQKIENKLGRERSKKWDSRTIDIDILLYGDQEIDLPELKIPHPGIQDRNFVKEGLKECGYFST